jgi:hypothetical protein
MSLTRVMKEYTALEPGTYKVQLMDLTETQLENPQYGNGDVIRFAFECVDEVDDEGNRYQLDGIANDILTSESKLTKWLAALGVTAKPGEGLDMAEAVGRECLAEVVLKPGKDGTGAFPRIDKLVPLPKGKAIGRTVAATETVAQAVSDDISSWWSVTRTRNWSRADVLKVSHEMFGAEPAELAPKDRAELLEALDPK